MSKIDTTRPFLPVRIAVMTVSDSRTLDTDTSGQALVSRIETAGHVLASRAIVPDDVQQITEQLKGWINDPLVDVVITSGVRV